MKCTAVAALACLLLAAANAHADQPASRLSKEYNVCIEKAGPPGFYDQSASAACDEAEAKRLKRRINKAYTTILKLWADDPGAVAQLDTAQKAWVQARDETYHLLQEHGASNGQTLYVVSSGYLMQALADRAELLEGIVAANGGG